MRSKKQQIALIYDLLILILLGMGLLLLLYPQMASAYNERFSSIAIENYQTAVEENGEEENSALLNACYAYNKELRNFKSSDGKLSDYFQKQYDRLLNLNNDGIMAYIVIPKIGVDLPIYHGTKDDVLAIGVGHLDYTSLPVGGSSTHCAMAGHSGYTNNAFFTDIQDLSLGDRFYIQVLDQTLTYEVDQIKTVLPYDVSDLGIQEGEDLVTLITCTPTGINSHRLLVRGKRVIEEETMTDTKEPLLISNQIHVYDFTKTGLLYAFALFIVLWLLKQILIRLK